MVDIKKLDNLFSRYTSEDKAILKDFFIYTETYNKYKNKNLECYYKIRRFLNGITIKSITTNSILKYFKSNTSEKESIVFLFIYYLCSYNLIQTSPLYRLLDFPETMFCTNLKLYNKKLIYWISLDEKYYKMFKSSLYTDFSVHDNYIAALFTLDKQVFQNTKLYDYVNDYFEQAKFSSQLKSCSLIVLLRAFNKVCNQILKYRPQDINKDILIIFFTQKKAPYAIIIQLLNILIKYNYISNPRIKFIIQTLNRIINIEKKAITEKGIIQIIESEKSNWFKTDHNSIFIINCTNTDTLEAIKLYLKAKFNLRTEGILLLKEFDNSLEDPLESLSIKTFKKQIEYFKNYPLKKNEQLMKVLYELQGIYCYYQNKHPDVFLKDGYSPLLLLTPSFVRNISDGYSIINHNPLDKVPKSDKWIFCYKITDSSDAIKVIRQDFFIVENIIFREWIKYYLWYNPRKIKSLVIDIKIIINALNYINDIKMKKKLSYFVTGTTKDDDISTEEILAYKNYIISSKLAVRTQETYLNQFNAFIKFISDNNIHHFDNGIFYILSVRKSLPKGNANVIPNNELDLISKKMAELAIHNDIYKLFYIIFYIACVTEFRLGQILNLEVDCVKPTAKRNEYIIYSETKTSNHEKLEQPISNYVKRSIDEIIEITKKYREANTIKSLNNFLFLVPSNRNGIYKTISEYSFRIYFQGICKNLNLKQYQLSNLRDTYMSRSEEYIIKQNFSDAQLKILTSHKSVDTTIQHYSRPSVIEVLEATNGVVIGNVTLNGQIKPKVSKELDKNENVVQDGCGFCSLEKCTVFSDLSCLLCSYFVTTINRKSYFEEQLKVINSLILTKTLPHDKEDLVNRKRLILGYINAIANLEEDIKNGR